MRQSNASQSSHDSAAAERFGDITYKVIGAAMKVHNQLGPGLREAHYHQALSGALTEASLSFEDEKPIQVMLDDQQLGLLFIDHFVEGAVVVEEKAQPHMLTDEAITYLAVTGAHLGLLINFGRRRLEYKRILPPKKFEDRRLRARRYACIPSPDSDTPPLIRSSSADDSGVAR